MVQKILIICELKHNYSFAFGNVGAKHWHGLSMAFRVDLEKAIKVQVKAEGGSHGFCGRTSTRTASLKHRRVAESLSGDKILPFPGTKCNSSDPREAA